MTLVTVAPPPTEPPDDSDSIPPELLERAKTISESGSDAIDCLIGDLE